MHIRSIYDIDPTDDHYINAIATKNKNVLITHVNDVEVKENLQGKDLPKFLKTLPLSEKKLASRLSLKIQ